jgi:hypothetical protein
VNRFVSNANSLPNQMSNRALNEPIDGSRGI